MDDPFSDALTKTIMKDATFSHGQMNLPNAFNILLPCRSRFAARFGNRTDQPYLNLLS